MNLAVPKILIVDHEALVRGFLHRVLLRAGYEVQTTGHHEEAMSICLAGGIDLVLADAGGQPESGHHLARRIAAECPAARVILMAAAHVDCELCPYSPRCELIRKPFVKDELLEAVARALEAPPSAFELNPPEG